MANQYGNLGGVAMQRGDKSKACAYWAVSKVLFEAVGIPDKVKLVAGWMAKAGCSPPK